MHVDASRAAFNIRPRCASEDGVGSLRRKTERGECWDFDGVYNEGRTVIHSGALEG
jgi:hypothetical protein